MSTVTGLSGLDLIGALTSLILTLLVFSYLLGDNPLFRLAIHVFVGVAAGLAAVIAWTNVIWPQLALPLLEGSQSERVLAVVPLVMSALLLMKISQRLGKWGSVSTAYLVGVAAATAIGGAVIGTLFRQVEATINLFDHGALAGGVGAFLEALVILVGTLATLLYFNFTIRPKLTKEGERSPLMAGIAVIGNVFIVIALGSLFSGVYAAALSAFVERWQFIGRFVLGMF